MIGNSSIRELITTIRDQLSRFGISARTGLGTDLFNFVSSLTPIVNVDLLVYNTKGQFLLTWRNDPHCGCGWHIPGGCIRFKETCEERIRKVAQKELGILDIKFDRDPIKVFEIISHEHRDIENQNERAHFITLVFKCDAPTSFSIDNQMTKEGEVGYMAWFDHLPDNLLSIQSCYREIIK